MAGASILDSSDEKSNGFKLMRLIVDGGTEALRKTFTRYRPGNLHAVLSTYQPSLLRLKPRFINENQWDKLYPTPPNLPNINDFDVTLLCVLLRNICGLKPARDPVWNSTPIIAGHSVEADIVRTRLFRNERFGHIPNTSVSSTDFKTYWAEISSPLVRLGIDQKEIDRLENELCGEEEVKRVLKEWKKSENEIINVLNENQNVLNENRNVLNENQNVLNDNRNVLNEHQNVLCEISADVKALVKRGEESRSDSVLKEHLVSFNFEREIESYLGKFTEGTRDWVFNQVLAWFNDETSPNRAFIISGLAGMGKSVIAAVICKKFAEHVGASHFFQYNNSQYNNPKCLLQSLAWHLCNAVPAYREALIDKLSGNLGQSFNDMNIEGLFSILFKEAFSGIADPGKRILIVLDALDESEYTGRDELGSVISNHLHKLPSYIRFVVTTRPEKNLIDKFKKLNPLYIEANDARNLKDLKLVLHERISSANAPTVDFINSLAEKCDGLMLYAFFLSEIFMDQSCKCSIESLPEGVEKYYERCFQRLEHEFTNNLKIALSEFHSFLSALAVAQEPLPEAFLETLFSFKDSPGSRQKLRKAINSISSFLVINEDKSVSFFHKSVRDMLVDNSDHDYFVDVPYGHQILFEICIKKLSELKERGVSEEGHADASAFQYALKYYIPHMLNSREISGKLERFVSDYVTDLEVLYASVRLNVDLTLNNLASLTNRDKYSDVSDNTRRTLSRLFSLIRKFAFWLREYPQNFLQNVVNQGGEELSLKAITLLQSRYKNIIYLELVEKEAKNDAVETRFPLCHKISGIDISPKHDYVVCFYEKGGIELFSLATGNSEWKVLDFKVDLDFVHLIGYDCLFSRCIVFHPVENLILPGRLDQVLTMRGEFTTRQFQCDDGCSKFTKCCFSLDRSRMVTYYSNNLIVWNISSGEKEKYLRCDASLISLCFTASGAFFGTTDIQCVFNIYNVMNDYNVTSMTFESSRPIEIFSTYDLNSWVFRHYDDLKIVNHDFTVPSCHPPYFDRPGIIRPLFCSEKQQCFFLNQPSWFYRIQEILNLRDMPTHYFLFGDNSVLIHSYFSNVMHVVNINAIDSAKTFVSDSNSDSIHSRLALKDSVCALCEQRFKESSRTSDRSIYSRIVTGGSIFKAYLNSGNCIPELWNCDMTQRLARFEQLAGTKRCISVSDQLIACVRQFSVIFFNVFTQEISSNTFSSQCITKVHACSIKYHVLARIELNIASLWKDGTRVYGWEDIVYKNTGYLDIHEAEFSPQGNILAFCSWNKNLFIFDVDSLSLLARISIPILTPPLLLNFFDNKYLICSSDFDVMLYFFNVERGEILTCVDLGKSLGQIHVCRERSIVVKGTKSIKVWLPRK